MSTPKAITDARAAVREAQTTLATTRARIAALDEIERKRNEAITAARKRINRSGPVLFTAPGNELKTAEGIGVFRADLYGLRDLKADTARKVRAAVMDGTVKVTMGDGSPMAVRTAIQRTRFMSKPTLAALKRADARVTRAAQSLKKARAERDGLMRAAFDVSEKPTVEQIADAIVARWKAIGQPAEAGSSWSLRYEAERAEATLATAQQHLDHALTRSKDACPCSTCKNRAERERWEAANRERIREREREEAKAAKAEARRRAKLPKIEIVCPNGQVDHGYEEDPHEYADENGSIPVLPDADGNLWTLSIVETEGKGKQRVRIATCGACGEQWNVNTVLSRPVGEAPGQQALIA